MTAPLTPFEETDDWTSLADEEVFLTALDGVGGMEVWDAGRSVQDRPIWACSVGSGTSTVLIGSLQHAPEPATRESSFALLRDLAYRTEPWMDAYLSENRVVVLPTICPDGKALGTRNNANDINLNRDWVQVTQPETRAVHAVIEATDPDIVMDAHETSGQPGGDWRPYPAGYPGEWPALRSLATDFVDTTEIEFLAQEWSTVWYPVGLLPFAGMSTVAGAEGRVGILTETVSVDTTREQRVNISYATYLALLQWHRDNRTQVMQARADARAASYWPGVTEYPTRQYIGTSPAAITSAVAYRLHEPLPQHLVDTFGIVVEDGLVSLLQPARRVIAALCDPASTEKVVAASPVHAEVVPGGTRGMVDMAGVRFPVRQIVTQQDGVRFPVRQSIVQEGGVRYRV